MRLAACLLLSLTGCALLCREENQSSPTGPPEVVERWWDDYLGKVSPRFAALLVEGSEALRREGKGGEWGDFFFGYANGPVQVYRRCTRLALPMPEACAARQRERLAPIPAEDLVPDSSTVTNFQSDEAAEKVWRQAAYELGYRENKE